MFITKKNHEERLVACMTVAHTKGYEEGYKTSRDEAREEFEQQIIPYNEASIESSNELKRYIDKLEKNLEIREKELSLAQDKVDDLEEALKQSILASRAMHDVANKLSVELKDANKKIYILNTFLRIHYDKEVARHEEIIRTTKKFRIKKKAESKILKLKTDRLAFER